MFTSKNKNSLRQGEQFKIMKKMFNKVVKNIGKSNYIGIEAADGDTEMGLLIDEFNKTLEAYKIAYKKHLNDIGKDNDLSRYYNKTVMVNGDTELYYITDKGVKRRLAKPSLGKWANGENRFNKITDSHKCPSVGENKISRETLELFVKGGKDLKYFHNSNNILEDGYDWQKCDYGNGSYKLVNGGVFIDKDPVGGFLAWYDEKGVKHNFELNTQKKDVNNSFPKMSAPILVKETEFSNMMDTSPNELTKTSPVPGIVAIDKNRVTTLNNKLISLAIDMKKKINNINLRNQDSNEVSTEAKNSLDSLIEQLTILRKSNKELKTEIYSLDGTIQDNTHLVKSINLRYIAWGISFITIGLIGAYQLKK